MEANASGMICAKCGAPNAAGDAFCGSCGAFLEFAAEEVTAPAPGVIEPAPGPAPGAAPAADNPAQLPAAPPAAAPSFPTSGPTCPACGRANPVGRTFCISCGERLPAAGLPAAGPSRAAPPAPVPAAAAAHSPVAQQAAPTAPLPTAAPPPTPTGPTWEFPTSARPVVAQGAKPGATPAAPGPAERRGRNPLPLIVGAGVLCLLLAGGGAAILLGSGGGQAPPAPGSPGAPRRVRGGVRGRQRRAPGCSVGRAIGCGRHRGAVSGTGHRPARSGDRVDADRRNCLIVAREAPGVGRHRWRPDHRLADRDIERRRPVAGGRVRPGRDHPDSALERVATDPGLLQRQPAATQRHDPVRQRDTHPTRAQGRLRVPARGHPPGARDRGRDPAPDQDPGLVRGEEDLGGRQPQRPGGDQRDPPVRHPDDPMNRPEFHASAEARARYRLNETLFELSGNVILANLRAVRSLAGEMTSRRRADGEANPTVSPGELNALGLVDEVLHAVVGLYREQEDPEAIDDALDHLDELLGAQAVDATLARFTERFPPLVVHRGELTVADYLASETDGTPNREVALEELANCWLANANPAADPFRELFDDADLAAATRYRAVIEELGRFFVTRSPFGPESQDLVTMLRAP